MTRTSLALLGLALLLVAGCVPEEETNTVTHVIYVPGPAEQIAVRVLDPAPHSLLAIPYVWQENDDYYPSDCSHEFVADTVFTATVVTDVPGGVHLAQVYYRRPDGAYYPEDQPFYPAADTFTVAFLTRRAQVLSLPRDSTSGAFCIRVTAGDQSNWISAAIPYRTVAIGIPAQSAAPAAPLLQQVLEGGYNGGDHLSAYWCRQSPYVDRCRIYYQSAFDAQPHYQTAYSSERNVIISDYLPECLYTFWAVAENSLGASPPSDTLQWFTGRPAFPRFFFGTVTPEGYVRLQWQNERDCDTLRVIRRTETTPWQDLLALGSYAWTCTDSTVVPATPYFYRLGLQFENGTWWSADSALVRVP